MPKRLHCRLHTRHISVVICAPDIDKKVIPTRELVAVIGDIGEQIGELAIALDEHAVFIIAVIGGTEPYGTAFFVDNSAFT